MIKLKFRVFENQNYKDVENKTNNKLTKFNKLLNKFIYIIFKIINIYIIKGIYHPWFLLSNFNRNISINFFFISLLIFI